MQKRGFFLFSKRRGKKQSQTMKGEDFPNSHEGAMTDDLELAPSTFDMGNV
jgi:hypothetical protein